MNIIRRVFDFRGTPLLAVVFAALYILEGRKPLRPRKTSRTSRMITNSGVSVPAFALLRLIFLPIMVKLAKVNEKKCWGLNYHIQTHPVIKGTMAFLIMDYSNYLWHVLNHKLPGLWRFHLVHHTDTDLDVTTAIRFHFGELVGSVFFRGAFVFLSGASALHVLLYEILFEGATQFHHSNWRLPYRLESGLNKLIVTPRMHGIHHSVVRNETDSNYSVIFSFWDRIHKTLNLDVDQHKIIIGVPSYSDPEELTAGRLLKLPFGYIRPWDAGMVKTIP